MSYDREYQQAYSAKHREKRIVAARRWRATHREQSLETTRRWRATHREQYDANLRRYYVEHKEQHDAAMCRRRALGRIWLDKYKAEHPCVDCGESDPIVLEFDHLPQFRSLTHRSIGTLIGSIPAMLEEIAKCEVACANCHRRRTFARKEAEAWS